jgi:DNA ligase-1
MVLLAVAVGDDVAAGDAVLNLFDYITLDEFNNGGAGSARQKHRSVMLQEWYSTVQDALSNVTVLSHETVDMDTDTGQARYLEINKQAIAGGYEGIMLKDPDAGYECKRTTSWLKLKPFIEVSLTVVDFEEGTGRNTGRLGAIICEGEDDGRRIRVNVGSGFSDSDRDNYWTGRDRMVKQIVEVRADAVTQNQDGTYSLRFPRFLKFRGFTAGEKI